MYGQVNSQTRTIGCVGFSTLLHAGILAVALILPSPKLINPKNGDGTIQFTTQNTEVKLGDQTQSINTSTQLLQTPTVADQLNPVSQSTIADPIIKSTPLKKVLKQKPIKKKIIAKRPPMRVKHIVAKAAPIKVHKFNTDALDNEALAKALESGATPELKPTDKIKPTPIKPMAQVQQPAPKAIVPTMPTTPKLAVAPQVPTAAPKPTTAPISPAAGPSTVATTSTPAYGLPNGVRDARFLKALPGNPKPVYPADDRLAGRQGVVRVIYTVTPAGRISEIRVVKNTGSSEMLNSTIAALRQYRFYPQQAGLWQQDFQFQLSGAPTEVAGAIHQ